MKNIDLAIISLDTVSDIKYSLLVFFDKESVVKIIDLMTTAPDLEGKNLLDLSPLFKSLIKETGSILLLKYVEALNYFLKTNSFPSPPKLRFGSIDSLKDHELKENNQDVPAVLVVECDIFTSKRNIAVDLAIVPHSETFDQFMKCVCSQMLCDVNNFAILIPWSAAMTHNQSFSDVPTKSSQSKTKYVDPIIL